MQWVLKRQSGGGDGFRNGGGEDDLGGQEKGVVRLRGLPFECSKEDIRDFFRGESII